jgi:hypothetical protein
MPIAALQKSRMNMMKPIYRKMDLLVLLSGIAPLGAVMTAPPRPCDQQWMHQQEPCPCDEWRHGERSEAETAFLYEPNMTGYETDQHDDDANGCSLPGFSGDEQQCSGDLSDAG